MNRKAGRLGEIAVKTQVTERHQFPGQWSSNARDEAKGDQNQSVSSVEYHLRVPENVPDLHLVHDWCR